MNGLKNIGNTCYLNSALQMIFHSDGFIKLIEQNKDNEKINIIYEFITNKKDNPKDIKKLVEDKCKSFVGSKQHDAGEFLTYFLDVISENVKEKLTDIYGIEINTRLKCKIKSCLNVVMKQNTNNLLILEINNNTTLDDIYRESKKCYTLDNDNMYHCEKCNVKRITSIKTLTTKWPNELIILLKRYQQNGTRIDKNNNYINIPLTWRHNYKIKGAIIHSGTLYGGHYIYVSCVNDKYYLFDDSSVKEINENQFTGYLSRAYVLHYIK